MIRYVLRCDEEHRFEAWFRSQADAERTLAPGQAVCPVCEKTVSDRIAAPSSIVRADGSVYQ
jgi:hypothetical protein